MHANNVRSLFVFIVTCTFLLCPASSDPLSGATSDTGVTGEHIHALKIVIDPGHGGKAPGGVGYDGEKEKDITLAIAKSLAKRLDEEGLEVLLTRVDDIYIPLEDRTAFANRNKADLFVSIHVNATESRSTDGVETYFLNLTTDASSIKVAERENAMSSSSLQGLQLIIEDLMLNARINDSSRFATSVQNATISALRKTGYTGKNHGVKQAPFYVLMGAQMPSILIETGFITNAADCMLLHDASHQEAIVDGIATGIKAFMMTSSCVSNSGAQPKVNP